MYLNCQYITRVPAMMMMEMENWIITSAFLSKVVPFLALAFPFRAKIGLKEASTKEG